MSINLGGLGSGDDRRRRRLAQEAEQEAQAERKAPPRPLRRDPAHQPPVAASPFESIVRRKTWAHCLVGLGLFVLAAFPVALGDWVDRLHPELSAAFGLKSGLLPRFSRVCGLGLAIQLAWSIWWFRSRSRKDFSARYRIWHLVVPVWILFAFSLATDAHWLVSNAVLRRWPTSHPHAALLIWLVPGAISLLALTRLLHREMHRNRASLIWIWTGLLAAAACGGMPLASPLLADARIAALVSAGTLAFWPLALCLSMLCYARHVMYVTSEPVPEHQSAGAGRLASSPGLIARWWQARQDVRELRRVEAKRARVAKQAAAAAAEKAAAERRTTPAETREARPQPVAARPAASHSSRIDAASRPTPHAVSRSSQFDDEDDDESDENDSGMRGLSKRERRRLRKLQRQERAA